MATASFLEGGGIDVCDKGSIKLSKLFYWYRADFGASESEVITWIFEHSSADIQWQYVYIFACDDLLSKFIGFTYFF